MEKKILIVGGSHSEIPLIQAAKELGLYVITTGNQAHGLGHQYSDESHLVDYSDNEAIYELAKKLYIDYICFGAHDLSFFSTVYVASKLGIEVFDDYETTKILHHKDAFKAFSQKYNLLTPRAYSFCSQEEAETFSTTFNLPCIIKPVDMGGGKGIQVVEEHSQLRYAIENAFEYSKQKKIVIEEYFEGSLHSFSSFIQNQKVVFYYADDEYPCLDNPYGVCTSTSPATGFEKIKAVLIEETNKVANLLCLKDGLLHMQYLYNGDAVTIVEFTRRMPGDMYNVPVEYSTGIEYAKNIVKFCCGIPVKLTAKSQKKFVSRHCILGDSFSNIIVDSDLDSNIIENIIWGDSQKINKKGIVFLEYSTYDEMKQKTENIHNLITVLP